MFMNLIKFLDQNEGKKIEVETERGIIRKVTLKEITYGVKYGELHIINSSNNDNVVINLNEIRNIQNEKENIIIILDDKEDTKIKISAV